MLCIMLMHSRLRLTFIAISLLVATPVSGQDQWQNIEEQWLREIFPSATHFSSKQGSPPVITALQAQQGNQEDLLLGYVFTTPDLPPEEIGFSGPIDVLIGMNLEGEIVGTKLLFYLESYKNFRGDFIGDSGYLDQFTNKAIDQEFRLGEDIDGMARATISSWAIARGVRNAARRVAENYLSGISYVEEANVANLALESLVNQSWQDYRDSGFVKPLEVAIENEAPLLFEFAYMGHYRLGELLIGDAAYSNADRTASGMIEDGHMMLVALSGNTVRLQQHRLGVMQDEVIYPNQRDRVVFAGTANAGKISGQARHAVAMYIDSGVDITKPFDVLYDTGARTGEFLETVSVEYQLPQDVLSLVADIVPDVSTEDVKAERRLGYFILLLLIVAVASSATLRILQLRAERH